MLRSSCFSAFTSYTLIFLLVDVQANYVSIVYSYEGHLLETFTKMLLYAKNIQLMNLDTSHVH